MFDDNELGGIFPTRTGTPAGSAQERTMLEAVGANSIRTRIVGDTMLRTRNGMPEFTSLGASVSASASLDRGFCCTHYTYIPYAKVSDPTRIDYVGSTWADKSKAKVETPLRYSITSQFSDQTGYADVITYIDGTYINGNKVSTVNLGGTPFLLSSSLDVVAVTDDSVAVGRTSQLASYSTANFKAGLSPALSGAGSSHLCRVSGNSAHVYLFGGYLTDNRRLNYDIELLATLNAVSVLRSQTGWFSDGGNVRLVDYDANPQTSTTGGAGEWRDPPACVLRSSPVVVQFTYTEVDNGDGTWDWTTHYVKTFDGATRFDAYPSSNAHDVSSYSNSKVLDESVIACEGFSLRRTATAIVSYERTRSWGWAQSYHWGTEEAGSSIRGGYFYVGAGQDSSPYGPINLLAHGSNERYTNIGTTEQDFRIESGGRQISLAVASFSTDSNRYSAVVDYAKTIEVTPGAMAWWDGRVDSHMGAHMPNYDLYFRAYATNDDVTHAEWEYGKIETTVTGSNSGSATVRDYIYYDSDNGVELWLEFRGSYSGPITEAIPSYVPVSSTLHLCANIFGSSSEVLLASSNGDLNPASLEVEYIPGESHKPTYVPINHCPCVFFPATHQGAFEYIAYMTKAERERSPKMEGTFFLSLPLFVTREPPPDQEVPTPDFPALTVIPKNISAFTSRFASTVLTANGTKVHHITASKTDTGWVISAAVNTGRHETAWRY